jgi:uncharacterized membrane protein YeaQ/YmgE (transglycosylase-associated protein family)
MGVYHRGATTHRDDDSADESGPFNPEESAMGFVWFILVGLVAGLLAGVIMKGSGYGMLGDIVVGVLGGLLGGGLVQALGIPFGEGLLGAVLVAAFGAVLLVMVLRLIKRFWGTGLTL